MKAVLAPLPYPPTQMDSDLEMETGLKITKKTILEGSTDESSQDEDFTEVKSNRTKAKERKKRKAIESLNGLIEEGQTKKMKPDQRGEDRRGGGPSRRGGEEERRGGQERREETKVIYFHLQPTPNPIQFAKTLRKIVGENNIGTTRETKTGYSIKPFTKEIAKKLNPDAVKAAFPNLTIVEVKTARGTPNAPTPCFIIKDVSLGIELDEIKEELEIQGFEVAKIFRIRSRQFDKDTRLIRVFCANKEKIRTAIESGVNIGLQRHRCEAPVELPKVVQCYNCQQFGHISTSCKETTKCLRCGGNHKVKDCTQEKKTAKCSNCEGDHPAQYKGCKSYKEAVQMKQTQVVMKERMKETEVKEAAAEKIKPEDVANFFIEAIKALQEKIPALSSLEESSIAPIVLEVAKKFLSPNLSWNPLKKNIYKKTTTLHG